MSQLTLKRSTWARTYGIVNLPLAYDENNNPILVRGKDNQLKHKIDPSGRYLFFELDSLDESQFLFVLNTYVENNIPVYYHRTMRGWHFLSNKLISVELHAELIRKMKHLNPECPHVTIRIKPNKWENEKYIFGLGDIWQTNYPDKIELFKAWIERQHIGLLKKHYKVVNYPFNDVCYACRHDNHEVCNGLYHELDYDTKLPCCCKTCRKEKRK